MESKITVKEYLAALKENRLLGLKCQQCGFVTTPPRAACRKCAGFESKVVELSGKGRITTFTSVYIAPQDRQGKTPYLVVMVELDEGPWIMGNLSGIAPNQATIDLIGKRVTMNNLLISGKPNPENIPSPMFVLDN